MPRTSAVTSSRTPRYPLSPWRTLVISFGCLAAVLTASPASSQTITFSVMGDMPYDEDEIPEFQQQMDDHDLYSPSEFLVHVGDIKSGSELCVEGRYVTVATMLKTLAVPAFIVPGDNEWTDCPAPDSAWAWWEDSFLDLEDSFCGSGSVERQSVRRENFAFVQSGVLFVGVNIPNGDAGDEDQRLDDNADWVEYQFATKGPQVRAAVVFGHAGDGSSRDQFFDRFRVAAAGLAKPVLYAMGDEHDWEWDQPWPEQNIYRVIVEAGGAETPVQITVTMSPSNPFQYVRDPWSGSPPAYNWAPCVDVGPDEFIDEAEVLNLTPLVSDDGVPGALSVTWSKASGPGTVAFGNRFQANTTAVFTAPGLYVLRLEANDGGLTGSDEMTVDVLSDNAPPRLSIDDVTLFEGDSGTVTARFTVTRGGNFGTSVNVNYATANGSAVAPSDYTAKAGTLSFSAFTITRTVSVSVRGDSNYELDETFYVDLSNATSGANITKSRGVGTIRNDDIEYHDVTVTVNGGGTVSLDPPGGSYQDGSTVTLTGVFNPGWAFDHWNGALTGTANPQALLVDADKSVTATFVPNDPPVAAVDSYSENEDVVLTVAPPGLLVNDWDPDGDPLEALPGAPPANGTLDLNVDGSFSYTPNENFHGQDGFSYLSSDGRGAVDTATVSIVVHPVNDPPTGISDEYATPERTPLVVGPPGVLGNDFDVEGNPFTALPGRQPGNGVVTVNPDGSFTYEPGIAMRGLDTFTYRATDGSAISPEVTVTVAVGDLEYFTFTPIEDAYVRTSAPEAVNGSNSELRVRGGDRGYTAYLKFRSDGVVDALGARLRMYVTDSGPDGGSVYETSNDYPSTGTPWTEDDLSASNAPPLIGNALDSVGSVSRDEWVEWDLGPAVQLNGTYSFAVAAVLENSVWYSSKEGSRPPELVVHAYRGTPDITLSPAGHDFGDLRFPAGSSATFEARNDGSADLAVSGTSLVGSDAADFGIVRGGGSFTLVPGETREIEVSFQPLTWGSKSAALRLTTDDPDELAADVALTARSITPDIAVLPASHDYGDVRVATVSSQTLEVRNDGTAALTVSASSLEGPDAGEFTLVTGGGAFVLAPGESHPIEVSFLPEAGRKSASLRLVSDDLDENPLDVMLSGRGVEPDIMLSPGSFDFGDVRVSTVATEIVEVRNDGTMDLTVSSASVVGSAEFGVVAGGGSFTVPPAGAHAIEVSYLPGSLGPAGAALRIVSDDADEGSIDLSLSGTGVEPDIATSAAHDYGDVRVAGSESYVLEVLNVGTSDLTVSGSSLDGADASEFSIVRGGGSFTVAPGALHEIEVTLGPVSSGAKSGTLHLASDDPDEGVVDVPLTGNGVEPEIAVNKAGYDYGGVRVEQGRTHRFEVRNEGTADLAVSETSLAGPDATEFQVAWGGGPFIIAPGQTHDVAVSFAPDTAGPKSAVLRLASDDLDEPFVDVLLSGSAIDPEITVAPAGHDFGDVRVATLSTHSFAVSNDGTADLTIGAATIEGPDASSFQIVAGGAGLTLAPGESSAIKVSFTPMATSSMSALLRLVSDDRDENPLDVTLAGRGVEPDIAVSVETHEFGDVLVSSLSSAVVDVRNEGTMDLTVTSTTVEGSADFAIVTGGGSFSVAPGAGHSIEVSFLPGTIGAAGAVLRIVSDDVDESSVDVSLSGTGVEPDIAASSGHDYGDVRVGTSSSHVFEVRNEGTSDLAVSGSSLEGPDAAEFSVVRGAGSFTLAPGERHEVEVALGPASPGGKSATLRLASDDPDESELDVSLSGNAIEPDITISTADHDYGDVRVTLTATHTFEIGNDGTVDLVVTSMSIDGPDAAEFGIDSGGDGLTLSPGETHEIVVSVTPASEGPKVATLRIASDDPDEDRLAVALTAAGLVVGMSSDSPIDSDGRDDFLPGDPRPPGGVPARLIVHAIFPNPFSAGTAIEYGVPEPSEVRLVIYNAQGRHVKCLAAGTHSAGFQRVEWTGRDEFGRGVASGVYFVRLEAAGRSAIRKLVLMR